jgi:hypothetical protein
VLGIRERAAEFAGTALLLLVGLSAVCADAGGDDCQPRNLQPSRRDLMDPVASARLSERQDPDGSILAISRVRSGCLIGHEARPCPGAR